MVILMARLMDNIVDSEVPQIAALRRAVAS